MVIEQQIIPFMDKKTRDIVLNGKIVHIIGKNKLLIEYKNDRYICVLNHKGTLTACYLLWS